MRKYSILCPFILLTLWLTACNGSPKFPALTVKALSPRDSLAYVLQYGDSLSRMDTVTLKGKMLRLSPIPIYTSRLMSSILSQTAYITIVL